MKCENNFQNKSVFFTIISIKNNYIFLYLQIIFNNLYFETKRRQQSKRFTNIKYITVLPLLYINDF